jgi:hypothetical protein
MQAETPVDRPPALSANKTNQSGIHTGFLLNERRHDSGLIWGDKPKTSIRYQGEARKTSHSRVGGNPAP